MADYDALAWFYDRYWRGAAHALALDAFERLVAPRLLGPARLLDLCCGAGHLDALLLARGHAVTGVDASAAMLEAARRNAPGARFEEGDVCRWEPPGAAFDAVLATFDSVNHVLEPAGLRGLFSNAAAALVPGGTLFFDVLEEDAYRTLWTRGGHDVADDHALVVRGGYDAAERLARVTITTFRRAGAAWRRADVTIRERCHTPEELAAALDAAGFATHERVSAEHLGQQGDFARGRVYVVARRPA